MAEADSNQPDVLDYAPIDERGGAVSVYAGDPGPVGAIAYLALTSFGDDALPEDEAADLVDRALGLPPA